MPKKFPTTPQILFELDVTQFRNAMGQFASYSEELEESRLRPWAEMLADAMLLVADKHIPSDRLITPSVFGRAISFTSGPGGGTNIKMVLPEDWNRLAIWLLEGVAPHPIWPTSKRALWWEPGTAGRKTRGAPNRKAKIIYQPDRPLRYVIHPGFKGYDYISKIEEDTLTKEIINPGGIATKIGKEAILRLTPSGPEAISRGSRRRIRGAKRVRRLFPHRFGGKG